MMTASNWIIRESGATRSLMKEKWHWSAKAKNRVLQNTPRKPAELLMLEMDRVTPVNPPANRNSKKREPRQKSWLQCHFLSLLPYLMNYLSYSQNVYISFCAQMADAMYGIIKPAIYACIDREFRKRYTQLSPLACCCLRKICRGSSQQGVAAENSRATQEGSV